MDIKELPELPVAPLTDEQWHELLHRTPPRARKALNRERVAIKWSVTGFMLAHYGVGQVFTWLGAQAMVLEHQQADMENNLQLGVLVAHAAPNASIDKTFLPIHTLLRMHGYRYPRLYKD